MYSVLSCVDFFFFFLHFLKREKELSGGMEAKDCSVKVDLLRLVS